MKLAVLSVAIILDCGDSVLIMWSWSDILGARLRH